MPIIAIEGIDGSGKGTQVSLLAQKLTDVGLRVGTISFPRYKETTGGALVGEYLNGTFGETVHPKLAAMLYAVDRFESKSKLLKLNTNNDVVLLDRYVGSNLAHQSARCKSSEIAGLIEFIADLEYETFGMPVADSTILLDASEKVTQENVTKKPMRRYTDKILDMHEADTSHLVKARAQYLGLAKHFGWSVVRVTGSDGSMRTASDICDELCILVMEAIRISEKR